MSDRAPTAAQIKAEALAARERVLTLGSQIQAEIADIEFAAFKDNRQPTAAELKRLDERESMQKKLHDELRVLAFVTSHKLDNSSDVTRLLDRMKAVNAGLTKDIGRLKRIERYAKIAAQVADAIAKVAERLAKIVASGAI